MSGVSAATVSSPSANAKRSGAFRWASWETRRETSRSSSRGSRTSWSNVSGMSWRQLGNWPSISREESATFSSSKTTWLRGSEISTASADPFDDQARELAQRASRHVGVERLAPSVVSSSVCLTERR